MQSTNKICHQRAKAMLRAATALAVPSTVTEEATELYFSAAL
jgi:hypothetical protein